MQTILHRYYITLLCKENLCNTTFYPQFPRLVFRLSQKKIAHVLPQALTICVPNSLQTDSHFRNYNISKYKFNTDISTIGRCKM